MKNDESSCEIHFPFVDDDDVVDEVCRSFVSLLENATNNSPFVFRFYFFFFFFVVTKWDKVLQHVSNIFNKWKTVFPRVHFLSFVFQFLSPSDAAVVVVDA